MRNPVPALADITKETTMTTIQLTSSSTYGSFAAATPRLRMTARGRRVLMALIVVPLLVVVAFLALNGGRATASNEAVTPTYVSVQQGESLWQLAEQVAPKADPRDVIADIVSLNGLASSDVVAGQRLAIPSQYLTDVAGK
jgi:LysM repeat protein